MAQPTIQRPRTAARRLPQHTREAIARRRAQLIELRVVIARAMMPPDEQDPRTWAERAQARRTAERQVAKLRREIVRLYAPRVII